MIRFAKKIARYFKSHNAITDLQYYLFQFAVEGLIYDLLILFICTGIGILFDEFVKNCIFLCAYAALRHYAGGFHAKTRNQCLICTCTICYSCLMIIKYFPPMSAIFFYIFSLFVLSRNAPYMSFLNPKSLQQELKIRLYFRRLIYLLTAIAALGIVLQSPTIYVPIFTAFGTVSILILISANKILSKQIFTTRSLKLISGIILSIGVTMVQTSCPHWLYEPDISESLRRYTDNL